MGPHGSVAIREGIMYEEGEPGFVGPPRQGPFDEYFSNYSVSGPRQLPGGTGVMNGASATLGPESVQGMGNLSAPGYQYQPPQSLPDIGELVGPSQQSKPTGDAGLDASLGYEPEKQKGIGLMGTLGILNLGAGIGRQIFNMVNRPSAPKPPPRAVPMPGGNAFR